jgi:hypothetical protein
MAYLVRRLDGSEPMTWTWRERIMSFSRLDWCCQFVVANNIDVDMIVRITRQVVEGDESSGVDAIIREGMWVPDGYVPIQEAAVGL